MPVMNKDKKRQVRLRRDLPLYGGRSHTLKGAIDCVRMLLVYI
jgi:hypothetical protein